MSDRATRPDAPEGLRNPGYEIFILALSLLSLVNILLVLPFSWLDEAQRTVVFIVDSGLTVVFLADFSYRLTTAENRRRYFFRERGWLDLIGSMPGLKAARIFRVLRVMRLIRRDGAAAIWQWLVRDRAQSALYVVSFLVVIVLEVLLE